MKPVEPTVVNAGENRRGSRLPLPSPIGEELLGRLRPRSVFARYVLAAATVVAALALRILLTPLTGRGAPFVLIFGAMLVTTILADTGPALLWLALSLPVGV